MTSIFSVKSIFIFSGPLGTSNGKNRQTDRKGEIRFIWETGIGRTGVIEPEMGQWKELNRRQTLDDLGILLYSA